MMKSFFLPPESDDSEIFVVLVVFTLACGVLFFVELFFIFQFVVGHRLHRRYPKNRPCPDGNPVTIGSEG